MEKRVLIIGSGPAGYSSAIYASRAGFNTTVIQGIQPGGQLTITKDVENYPGYENPISGPWLMEQMEKQAKNVGADIIFDTIKEVDFSKRPFVCKGDSEKEYISDVVIIATGAKAKWLGVKGEEYYSGYGVSGCATCDGFFFRNKKVIVVGGGNAAVEEAIYLSGLASNVVLIHRRDSFRAEYTLQQRLFKNKKIDIIWDSVLEEITGNEEGAKKVTSVRIKNIKSEEVSEISTDGVFIAIGHTPSTEIFKGKLDLDDEGYIKVKPNTTITSVPGVFAVGDVQDKVYRQAVTAAGSGCMGALDAEKFLSS